MVQQIIEQLNERLKFASVIGAPDFREDIYICGCGLDRAIRNLPASILGGLSWRVRTHGCETPACWVVRRDNLVIEARAIRVGNYKKGGRLFKRRRIGQLIIGARKEVHFESLIKKLGM